MTGTASPSGTVDVRLDFSLSAFFADLDLARDLVIVLGDFFAVMGAEYKRHMAGGQHKTHPTDRTAQVLFYGRLASLWPPGIGHAVG